MAMTNGQRATRGRHLETALNGTKLYVLQEIRDLALGVAEDLPVDFVGATASLGGASGLVPKPNAGDNEKFLRGDGTWATVSGGSSTAYNPAAYAIFNSNGEQIGSVPVNECTRLTFAQIFGFPTATQDTYLQQLSDAMDCGDPIYDFFWFDIPAKYKTGDFSYIQIDFTCEKTVSAVWCNRDGMVFSGTAGIQYLANLTDFGLVTIFVDA